MGHRIVKRVPLEFDEPLNKVWRGYVMPDELRPACCPTCGPSARPNPFGGTHWGDGLTIEARAIDQTFYSHMIGGPMADALAWHDKLGQDEVDHLIAEGRLRTYRQVPEDEQCGIPCDDAPEGAVWRGKPCRRFSDHEGHHHPRPGEWCVVPRSADEVNALNRAGGLDSHDGINRLILCEFRCARLGIERQCPTCEGEGSIYSSDEQRAAHEAWEGTEPPVGDGWQLWETTSEGSPVSPVFETAAALATWCESGATAFASIKWTAAEWLASFEAESTDVDTLLVIQSDGTRVQP